MLKFTEKCPFCAGSEVSVLEVDVGAWAVCCKECGAIGPTIKGKPESAIDSWNMRLVLATGLGVV
jgi:Lar family restriction alleviation protein